MSSSDYTESFLTDVKNIAEQVDPAEVDRVIDGLAAVREQGGRLFIIGSGGGAGHASHAVCDFRKICGFEAYAPTDNVSELTARTNDEGWETTVAAWLETSRINSKDALLVFSVGGGSKEHEVSMNLVNAIELAKSKGASIFGIVGKESGETAKQADACLVVKSPPDRLTPLVEGYQAVLWHLIVSHPKLAANLGKWESIGQSTSGAAVS